MADDFGVCYTKHNDVNISLSHSAAKIDSPQVIGQVLDTLESLLHVIIVSIIRISILPP